MGLLLLTLPSLSNGLRMLYAECSGRGQAQAAAQCMAAGLWTAAAGGTLPGARLLLYRWPRTSAATA